MMFDGLTPSLDKILVDNLWKRKQEFVPPHKKEQSVLGFAAMLELMTRLEEGHEYTSKEMCKTKYWDYIKCYHKSWQEEPLTKRAYHQQRKKFLDTVNLFNDIKKNGMRDPLDIIMDGDNKILYRGSRRLVVLKVLGTEKAAVNLYLK